MGEWVRGRADGSLLAPSRKVSSCYVLVLRVYPIGYEGLRDCIYLDTMMIKVLETDEFKAWLAGLRDRRAKLAIGMRLTGLALGLLGDARPVGDGVSELRIHMGPGYRIYVVRRGDVLIVLLHGGDKRSQVRDIEKAKAIARSFEW